ncbi:Biotin synthase [Dirofilaria immitis]
MTYFVSEKYNDKKGVRPDASHEQGPLVYKVNVKELANSSSKTYPKSHGKTEDAIAMLSRNELKNFYDKDVKKRSVATNGILQRVQKPH